MTLTAVFKFFTRYAANLWVSLVEWLFLTMTMIKFPNHYEAQLFNF